MAYLKFTLVVHGEPQKVKSSSSRTAEVKEKKEVLEIFESMAEKTSKSSNMGPKGKSPKDSFQILGLKCNRTSFH